MACRIFLSLFLFSSYAGPVSALDSHECRKEKCGWFWYKYTPPHTDEKENYKKADNDKTNLIKKKIFIPKLSDYTYEQLYEMHPDELKPLMEAFQKKAIQKPTIRNVTEYKLVEDIARRKARSFAAVNAFVLQTNPALNVGKDYPSTTRGRVAFAGQRKQEVEKLIRFSKGNHALLYFFRRDCPYCAEQENILKYFQVKYGWRIRKIDIRKSPGLASLFKADTVPRLELVRKGSRESIPVAAGVVSLSEIEERLYRAIRFLDGNLQPENWSTYGFQKGGSFDILKPLNIDNAE